MLSKRLTVRGTVLRARSLDEKIQVTRLFAQEVVPSVRQGLLRATIDSTFKLADIAKAHARLESNESVGKVDVIELDLSCLQARPACSKKAVPEEYCEAQNPDGSG